STRLAQKSGGNLLVGYTYEFRGRLFAAGNLVQKRRESIPLGIVALRIRRIAIERNRNLHQQAAIVIQFDLGAMHLAHRSDQTQAEAGAFGRAVFVEAVKTFEYILAFVEWNAGAAVAHFNLDGLVGAPQANADGAAFGCVFVGVVEQVAYRLQPQFAIAVDRILATRHVDVE